MAPIKTLVLAGLTTLVSESVAVKLLATHFSGTVYTLDFDGKSTTKITSQTKGCGVTPTWLHLDSSSNTAYCFDESWMGSGVLSQYTLDSQAALKLQASARTAGNTVHGSTYGGTDGKGFIATVEYSPSTLTTYKLPITSNTKALQTRTFTQAKPGPRPDRQEKPHPHSAFTDPTGNFLLVPDLGADLTRIFRINQNTGALSDCPAISSNPGDGPRHGVFNKIGDSWKYYSLNEVSSSVGVYDVKLPVSSNECLSLTLVQTVGNYGPNVPIGNATVKSAEIRIAGSYLYASNRNDSHFGKEQDSIAQFKIGADGKLAFVELANSYSYYPRSFVINKAGNLVAIGGQTTSNVVIVKRDTETGKLGPLVSKVDVGSRGTYGGEDGLSSVTWVE
ncbi:putative isomerase YbhE [Westerdykella ornata]|uniref:Putative isomerase YbhE n=1 Tax=Westerdykella ornata TaxID=318751 RepID=A0A6A6J724_WESOR|nr:putative isomerase YbhE [Westerdykella ornata]KAF2272195.1 putative isomerase YbhE [Westerdykella ornata]